MKIDKCSLLSLIDSSDKSIRDFDCQDPEINDFLHEQALEFDKAYRTQTSLFYDEGRNRLAGFYSTSVGLVEIYAPGDFAYFKSKGMIPANFVDDSADHVFMPALRLNYIGRDRQYSDLGIGSSMVYNLFENFIDAYMEHGIGMSGILLDSTVSAIDFYKDLGFKFLHDRNYSEEDLSTNPRPMFIDFKTISESISHS